MSITQERPQAAPEAEIAVPLPLGEVFALAVAAEEAGRLDETARLAAHMLRVAPDRPEVLHLAGLTAFRQKRHADAVALLERSIACGVEIAGYLRNICEVYRVMGRYDDALAAIRSAAALAPSDPHVLHNMSVLHHERLEPAQAEAAARAAILMQPDHAGAHFALAETLLLQGQWAEGWEEYEWRFRSNPGQPPMPPTGRPQWQGEPSTGGTLLVVADQGFGDVIQFARYLPWLRERWPDLVVGCSRETEPLLRQIMPGLATFQEWAHCPPFDAHITLSGLPRLHATRPESVPQPAPYLFADRERVVHWGHRLDQLVPSGHRRVGIVWAGRAAHNNDRNRSTTLKTFAPLAALPRTTLVSLQRGAPSTQAADYFGRAPLINLGQEIWNYTDTMAVMEHLDLIVSVDTSVAHLAGAMGRPTWIMLPHAPDWRWLMNRNDTPWYKSIRLFRQTNERIYAPILQKIAETI